MLTKFERNRAKELQARIDMSFLQFTFDPSLTSYKKELEELQSKCDHEFLHGRCVNCCKESKK